MIDRNSPVTEDELHAYVDGELPADRKVVVAAWLADHPEQAALVASWRAQAESIRAHFGGAVDEPVPQRLKLDQVLKQDQANGRSWMAMAAAAAVMAFIVGGAAGWMARGASAAAPSNFEMYASEALDAHKLYVGRGASSGRGAWRRAGAHDAVAVAASGRRSACSRSSIDRTETGWRQAASWSDRCSRFLYVRRRVRRAFHHLLRQD